MTAEAGSTPSQENQPEKEKLRKAQIEIGVGILVAVFVTYALSLLGIHLLQRGSTPLAPLDLSQGGGDATIVQLRVEELNPVANHLTVNVLVYPGVAEYDSRFDVLGTDVAVRLYPTSDLGDLEYPRGKAPRQLTSTIEGRAAIPVAGHSTRTRPSRSPRMRSSDPAMTAERFPPSSR